MEKEPKSGEVWLVNIDNVKGHQQGGIRPFLVLQNNIGNRFSPIIDGLTMTSSINKWNKNLPNHARYYAGEIEGLPKNTILQAECHWHLNKTQFIKKLGTMNEEQLIRASVAMAHQNPISMLAYQNGVLKMESFIQIASA